MPNEFTFLSLFAGIGGFDKGLEQAGWVCKGQGEIDEYATEVLEKHWPEVARFRDVRDCGKHNLPAVKLICGGFPCQDVSVAGRRKGLAGERSGLWFEFHRILEECRPEWFIVENVPGLLSSNKGRDFAIIIQGLAELGYGVVWRILDAQYFGVAQRRRRVFIVGHLGDGRAAEVLFESSGSKGDPPPSRKKGKDIARPLAHSSTTDHYDESQQTYIAYTIQTNDGDSHKRKDRPEGGMYVKEVDTSLALGSSDQVLAVEKPIGYSTIGAGHWKEGIRPLCARDYKDGGLGVIVNNPIAFQGKASVSQSMNPSGVVPSLDVAKAGGICMLGSFGVRRLTPTECERLQGFPDGHTAGQSDSKRYRQLGNAVAVPVVEWIAKRIMQVSKEIKE